MIKEGIQKIIDISEKSEIIDLYGEKWIKYPDRISLIDRPLPPRPEGVEELRVSTLTGIIDIIESLNRRFEDHCYGELVVYIFNHSTVVLQSDLLAPWNIRLRYATAEAITESFSFGRQHSLEEFIINLQSRFVMDDNLKKILQIVGNLKHVDSQSSTDDGYTQNVTVKKGITQVEKIDLPNPVTLRPYRTFLEVEQPCSDYVFRITGGGDKEPITAALFSAEGGMWKLKAIESIAAWFGGAIKANGLDNVSIVA